MAKKMRKYDVFISYRRKGGCEYGKSLAGKLVQRGYRVFFDYDSLRAGKFNEAITKAIEGCKDFILILSPDALERCVNEEDWVRKEILIALEMGKNIIPVLIDGFDWQRNVPKDLPESLRPITDFQSKLRLPEYDDALVNQLINDDLKALPVTRIQRMVRQLGLALCVILLCFVLERTIPSIQMSKPVQEYLSASIDSKDVKQSHLRSDFLTRDEYNAGSKVMGSDIPRSEITSIRFLGDLKIKGKDSWDVSESRDGSVMAWVEDGMLTIAGEGGVSAPANASWLFAGYENVSSISFNGCFSVDNVKNMQCMFFNCGNLTSIDFSSFVTGNVQDMGHMFSGCSSLNELDLSMFDTSSATTMEYMFYGCNNLRKLDVSGFITDNVLSFRSMFKGCTQLEMLDISSFNTQSAQDLSHMFDDCRALHKLDVSGFRTDNVNTFTAMFQDCSSIKELDVSGFNTRNAQSMQNMFGGCESVLSLDVSGFRTNRVTDMSNMFRDCRSLVSLDVSGFDTTAVRDMSWMFVGCNNLPALDVSGFRTIDVTTMVGMFKGCRRVVELDVARFDTTNVTDMSSMFENCESLNVVDVSGFSTGKVTAMAYMFQSCQGLSGLDLTGFDTGSVGNMCNMFCDCVGLRFIRVGDRFVTRQAIVNDMFLQCSTSIVLGDETLVPESWLGNRIA